MVARMSEDMKINISSTTKQLLDKIGGFRCEYYGILDLGVRYISVSPFKNLSVIRIINY